MQKNKTKKDKQENTNIYMYSAGYDVNGTIANKKKRKNFLRETINTVLYSFILSACFVVFFCKYGF